jgi:hypothetical protein
MLAGRLPLDIHLCQGEDCLLEKVALRPVLVQRRLLPRGSVIGVVAAARPSQPGSIDQPQSCHTRRYVEHVVAVDVRQGRGRLVRGYRISYTLGVPPIRKSESGQRIARRFLTFAAE